MVLHAHVLLWVHAGRAMTNSTAQIYATRLNLIWESVVKTSRRRVGTLRAPLVRGRRDGVETGPPVEG